MGSFDFYNPRQNFRGHFFTDILPWIHWGNTEDDPTTKADRISALKALRHPWYVGYANALAIWLLKVE
jgi:hypothetical protein